MATPKKSPYKPSGHVWMLAQQFYNAGNVLLASSRATCPMPIVMNYAFAAELALKAAEVKTNFGPGGSFTIEEGSPSEPLIGVATLESTVFGHDLVKVFDRLNKDTQTGISNAFYVETEQELLPLLARCAKYFIDARYVFEHAGKGFDIGSLEILSRGLLNAVMQYGGGTARVECAQ